MPLNDSVKKLAEALKTAAKSANGDGDMAWENVAEAITKHITANAVVTGTTPNGGPLMEGKIT